MLGRPDRNPLPGRSTLPSTPTGMSGYMPQLDALRALAVMLVILFHWFPTGEGINWLPNGTIGVMIFFVISGFLITRILLTNRNQILAGQSTPGGTYRKFFVRRVLRIFPLYYAVITFVLLVLPQTSDINDYPFYYYLYGYNILLDRTGNWADLLSPFWTLAVEEQLYLVWPWIVLLAPKRIFGWLVGGMIVGSILFRAGSYEWGNVSGVLTPANLDSFGLGAFWAYMVTDRPNAVPWVRQRLGFVTGLALLSFAGLMALPGSHWMVVVFQRFLVSVLALFLVIHASTGFGGLTGRVFNNRGLQYVGRVSYGIYVFHMLVPGYLVPFLLNAANHIRPVFAPGYWTYRLLSLVVLIGLASLSWYAFEKPVNGLKRYFSYN